MHLLKYLLCTSLALSAFNMQAMQGSGHISKKRKLTAEEETAASEASLRKEFYRMDKSYLLINDPALITNTIIQCRNGRIADIRRDIERCMNDRVNYAFVHDIFAILKALGHPLKNGDDPVYPFNGLRYENKIVAQAITSLRARISDPNLFFTLAVKNTIVELRPSYKKALDEVELRFDESTLAGYQTAALNRLTENCADDIKTTLMSGVGSQASLTACIKATIERQTANYFHR